MTTEPLNPEKHPRYPSQHDGLAITAFVTAWVIPFAGFILGIVSVRTAHREHRKASSLAISGIVIGAAVPAAIIITVIAVLSAVHSGMPPAAPSSPSCDISNPLFPYC